MDVLLDAMYANLIIKNIGWLDVRIHGEGVVVSAQEEVGKWTEEDVGKVGMRRGEKGRRTTHHYPPIEYTLFVDMAESRWKAENISDVANHERIGQVVQLTCVAVLNALLEEIQPLALDRMREFAAEGLNIQVIPRDDGLPALLE